MSQATELEPLVIGPEHNGMRMTPEEFDAVEDWDENHDYELIDGVLVVSPPAAAGERSPNDFLGYLLIKYAEEHPNGPRLDGTIPKHTVRTPRSRRRADRALWVGLGRQPDEHTDVPSIVIEFLSPGRRSWKRDYVEKRKEYLAIGVQAYWIIDRFQRTLTAHTKHRGRVTTVVVSAQQTYRPALLPGFELPVGKLLAAADRWAEV